MRYARARASWKAIANQGQHDDQQKSSVEATVVVSLFLVGKTEGKMCRRENKTPFG